MSSLLIHMALTYRVCLLMCHQVLLLQIRGHATAIKVMRQDLCRKIACEKDGKMAYGNECCKGRLCKRKKGLIAGVLVSVSFMVAVAAFCAFLRCPIKGKGWELNPARLSSLTGRTCQTKVYTYEELSEATGRSEENKGLTEGADGDIHVGLLSDGTHVAVQTIRCETEQDLMQVLNKVGFLSQISHRNIASILGCCIGSRNALLLVHEFTANGTLEELLRKERAIILSWFHRISIATEVANILAYLQFDVQPPIYLHNLKSSDILVDMDYSVKISTFKFSKTRSGDGFCSYVVSQDSHDMYNFGLLLMEMITGSNSRNLPHTVLPRLSDGTLIEIVDPCLRFYEQTPGLYEQVENVAHLAERCLISSRKGESCILEIAKDLGRLMKQHIDSISTVGPELEQTLSDSSLLQMISNSPD
ncbi:hypothetical protein Taro_020352, partial [Colocasia esculenta]|nr:hypothetical protein [Colocasia esculenta]